MCFRLLQEAEKADELRRRAQELIRRYGESDRGIVLDVGRGAKEPEYQSLIAGAREVEQKAAKETETNAWDLAVALAKRNPVIAEVG